MYKSYCNFCLIKYILVVPILYSWYTQHSPGAPYEFSFSVLIIAEIVRYSLRWRRLDWFIACRNSCPYSNDIFISLNDWCYFYETTIAIPIQLRISVWNFQLINSTLARELNYRISFVLTLPIYSLSLRLPPFLSFMYYAYLSN